MSIKLNNSKSNHTLYAAKRIGKILLKPVLDYNSELFTKVNIICCNKNKGAEQIMDSLSRILSERVESLFRLRYLFKKQTKVLKIILRTHRIRQNNLIKETIRHWRIKAKLTKVVHKKEVIDYFMKVLNTTFKERKNIALTNLKRFSFSSNLKKSKKEMAARSLINI